MATAEKKEIVSKLKEMMGSDKAIYLLNYLGLNVEQDNLMRRALRKSSIDYLVQKNTLIKIALKENGVEGLDEYLVNDTSVAISSDLVDVVKTLKKFEKEYKGLPKGKAVYYNGTVYTGNDLVKLAELPSRDELLAKAVGSINAPITGLVYSLSGVMKKLVYAVNAIKESKE